MPIFTPLKRTLFSANPVYTKIRDDNPTRYINGSRAENIMAADGCVIEGEVENSVLFRGVKIGKGAKVKNCVLMQDTVVEEGANLEYIVTDKDVTITAGKEMRGTDSLPVYVAKRPPSGLPSRAFPGVPGIPSHPGRYSIQYFEGHHRKRDRFPA